MTTSDPILIALIGHFQKLLDNPEIAPDEKLIYNAEYKLMNDTSFYEDESALRQLAPLILQLIQSNNTTANVKNSAISILSIMLPHYSFDQILGIFNLDLIIFALKSNKSYLQSALIEVLKRAQPIDTIAESNIVLTIIQEIGDRNCDIGVSDKFVNCLAYFAEKSELIREKILSNQIMSLLENMKHDSILASRMIDFVIEILPFIPGLPKDLYLISESDILGSDDPLFVNYILFSCTKLLDKQIECGKLSFLETVMQEQFKYIAKMYVDDSYMEEQKGFANTQPAVFLGVLSRVFPRKFTELDNEFSLLQYSIKNYLKLEASNVFLRLVDPSFLSNEIDFFDNLEASSRTIDILINIFQSEAIFKNSLTMPAESFVKLNAIDFFKVLEALVGYGYGIERLVGNWSPMLVRLLNSGNALLDSGMKFSKYQILRSIQSSGHLLGQWKKNIDDSLNTMSKNMWDGAHENVDILTESL